MKKPRSLSKYLVTVPGTWPALELDEGIGVTPDEYKDLVVANLHMIFTLSGLNIDILDSRRDAKRSAALEVRFGPLPVDENGDAVADGIAWDIGPRGLPGCDRFNARWDGQVALFLRSNLPWHPHYEATLVAHEVGHALGLRHVLSNLAPNEVMDYDYQYPTLEAFNDVVMPITEPPEEGGTVESDTHNPAYHLKRYVLGEDPGTSRPGTWDIGSVTIQKFEISSLAFSGQLHNVTMGFSEGSGSSGFEGETWSNVAYFAEVDPAVDTLSFYSYADFPLSIFASSEAGDVWDIVFGTGDAQNPVLSFENLASGPLDGLLFQYDAGTDAYHVVGSFSGGVAEELTLWGRDPEPIPEPATMVLLALAGLAGVMWRLPRLARRRPAA